MPFLTLVYTYVWKHNCIVFCYNYLKHTFIHILLPVLWILELSYHCRDSEVHIIQKSLDLMPEFLIVQDEHMLICFDVPGVYVWLTVDHSLTQSQKLAEGEVNSEDCCLLSNGAALPLNCLIMTTSSANLLLPKTGLHV